MLRRGAPVPSLLLSVRMSAEEMQKFVASYPAFRQENTIVSKHIAMVSELSRIIDERRTCSWS
jgi:hypothetical protein